MIRRYPNDYEKYFDRISEIITNPNYVGKSQDNSNGMELVKLFDNAVLVSIKINI